MKIRQMAIKDPYQQQFEKLKLTAADQMTELTLKNEKLDDHVDNYRNDYMDDV